MSRDKFEAKYSYLNLTMLDENQYIDEFTQTKYEGWLAGRESMRDEVCPIIFGQCESDNVAQRTVDAIRKIEL